MDEAARLQKQNPKKIIIDMYTTWCGPCRMLDRNTFSNKSHPNDNSFIQKWSKLLFFDEKAMNIITFSWTSIPSYYFFKKVVRIITFSWRCRQNDNFFMKQSWKLLLFHFFIRIHKRGSPGHPRRRTASPWITRREIGSVPTTSWWKYNFCFFLKNFQLFLHFLNERMSIPYKLFFLCF